VLGNSKSDWPDLNNVCRGLPDTDTAFFNLGKMLDRKDVTDSYVTAYLDNCRILMTSVKVRLP
jgi:hypothetical protein